MEEKDEESRKEDDIRKQREGLKAERTREDACGEEENY